MSVYVRDTTIDIFLAAAAAKRPTPGGGSVAALAGALAASMGEMVVNYSLGRKDLSPHAGLHARAVVEFSRARGMLLELMEEDQLAFAALTAVKKMPAEAPGRAATLDAAVASALGVPQAIAATGLAILRLAVSLADNSNKWLSSDLAVCGELALATVRCGNINVRANLPELASESVRAVVGADCDSLSAEGVTLIKALSARLSR